MQLCVRFSWFVPTKTTLLGVENGVLVERVVDAKLLLESDLEGTAFAKIPADGLFGSRI